MYEVLPLRVEELPEVRELLAKVFGAPDDHPPFQVEVLRWKMFTPHPFWTGPRCYGVRHQGQLVAHGALLPLRFLTPTSLASGAVGEVSVSCVIDWAADPQVRGGGVAISMEQKKWTAVQIGIGGSAVARSTLPRLGYRVHQLVGHYERRERIVAYHLAVPLDWKSPLRAGRDLWRKWRSRKDASTFALAAKRVAVFGTAPGLPMPQPQPDASCSARTPAFLDYMLQCPAANMEGYILDHAGIPVGYCVLSRVKNTCRVADLWVDGPQTPERWGAAISSAVQLALKNPQTATILMAASTPFLRSVLENQGFRLVEDLPFFIRGNPMPTGPVHVSMLDNDAFYLP